MSSCRARESLGCRPRYLELNIPSPEPSAQNQKNHPQISSTILLAVVVVAVAVVAVVVVAAVVVVVVAVAV